MVPSMPLSGVPAVAPVGSVVPYDSMFDVPCVLSRETYSTPSTISTERVSVLVSIAVALLAPSSATNTPWVSSPFTPWPEM